ncbi:MAG TPA: cyclase family protein [Gaiellaceae bacterium]|nr:cyclase family protein [Gaiellaceae bacterium]
MAETVIRGRKKLTFYDLSDTLSNDTSEFEPNAHRIEYLTPEQTAATSLERLGLGPGHWPDGQMLAAETVTLTTHSGTHVDAPAHYGPATSGRAMTIDEVPLAWCYGDAVRLDLRGKGPQEGITLADVEAELACLEYSLKPDDIVLVWTGTDLKQPGYENRSSGLRREATEFLVDSGVHLIGIDAWGLDRPFPIMVEDARAGRAQIWESHLLGREKPYLQIERLANLDSLPAATGFTVIAFPFKLERASAGWARVVAIVEDEAEQPAVR